MKCHLQVLSDTDSDHADCGSDSDREAETSFMEDSKINLKSAESPGRKHLPDATSGTHAPVAHPGFYSSQHKPIKVVNCPEPCLAVWRSPHIFRLTKQWHKPWVQAPSEDIASLNAASYTLSVTPLLEGTSSSRLASTPKSADHFKSVLILITL